MKLKFKAIKKDGTIQKLGRLLLFFVIASVLIYHLKSFNWYDVAAIQLKSPLFLVLAVILTGFNWYFEWIKWKIGMMSINQFPISILKKGFYAGMLSGFVTPSALGNFLGRMTAVDKELKTKVVANTIMGNGAQFFISILFGTSSLLLINGFPWPGYHQDMVITLFFFLAIILLVYLTIGINGFLEKFSGRYLPSLVSVDFKVRSQFLFYSLLRYLVFSFQFFLIIKAFKPDVNLDLLFWIWQLYLWTTLSPSIFMGKLFIRETMAIFILSFAGVELPIALFSSILLWLMNNALPSLFAYFKWKQHVLVQV